VIYNTLSPAGTINCAGGTGGGIGTSEHGVGGDDPTDIAEVGFSGVAGVLLIIQS